MGRVKTSARSIYWDPSNRQALQQAMQERVKLGRHDVLTDYPQGPQSEAGVLESFRKQGLTALSPERQHTLAEDWRQLRNVRVGTHYNPYLRYLGAAGNDMPAYRAAEKLFELSYARTQTPLPELPELQKLHDIRRPSAKGGIFKELLGKPGSIRQESGGPDGVPGIGGMPGAMGASYDLLRSLVERGVYGRRGSRGSDGPTRAQGDRRGGLQPTRSGQGPLGLPVRGR